MSNTYNFDRIASVGILPYPGEPRDLGSSIPEDMVMVRSQSPWGTLRRMYANMQERDTALVKSRLHGGFGPVGLSLTSGPSPLETPIGQITGNASAIALHRDYPGSANTAYPAPGARQERVFGLQSALRPSAPWGFHHILLTRQNPEREIRDILQREGEAVVGSLNAYASNCSDCECAVPGLCREEDVWSS